MRPYGEREGGRGGSVMLTDATLGTRGPESLSPSLTMGKEREADVAHANRVRGQEGGGGRAP